MDDWSPQLFKKNSRGRDVSDTVIENALASARILRRRSAGAPPLFSLRHLSYISGADYGFLRRVVSRSAAPTDYRVFRLRKRACLNGVPRYRVIAIPSPDLMQAQRWICQEVISRVEPHAASTAFSKGSTLVKAVEPHCGCKWLIKMDVRRFFESINEIAVYRVFRRLGYQALVSFEMARICTRMPYSGASKAREAASHSKKWGILPRSMEVISAYSMSTYPMMGHLPQGAPTSPMLSNLVAREFDEKVEELAAALGWVYTRYADDICFSTSEDSSHADCRRVIGMISKVMGKYGFSPNSSKTKISGPGSRKIVLGLLADGDAPRLTRQFRAGIRQHVHYLKKYGPSQHSVARGFLSVIGLRNHLFGLLAYARQVDPIYALSVEDELRALDWAL
ncbi:reverse transcriptase family protein [Stenotrophomonas sp.]|uniref:reverse transcriptase family protein n=1 Tax=Stenotrophomonas sp. TaxID=69392 RepID=UPI0028AA8D1E|nr:reverse transcriptase family protein [Stenotrophomonas sp.]